MLPVAIATTVPYQLVGFNLNAQFSDEHHLYVTEKNIAEIIAQEWCESP